MLPTGFARAQLDTLGLRNTMRRIGLRLLVIIAIVVLSPLLLLLFAVALFVSLGIMLYAWMALRTLCWRSGTWQYLVCSPQRDWNEFVQNNVEPVLPKDVRIVWTERKNTEPPTLPWNSLLGAGFGLPKPYIAVVTPWRIRTMTLHHRLLPLKSHAAKNADIQESVRAVLAEELHR